jgi:hypothetical protein
MTRAFARILPAALLCLTPTAFAQTADETVSLALVASSACGANGWEVRRTDRGPEGAYTPVATPYVVPNGFRLEVTDITYEIGSVKAPGLAGILNLWTRDRASGQSYDGFLHKYVPESEYAADSNGVYRPQGTVHVKWGGTYHVGLQSGLQVSARTRLCVTMSEDRFMTVSFRGRLVAAPTSVGGGSTHGGVVIGGGGVFKP